MRRARTRRRRPNRRASSPWSGAAPGRSRCHPTNRPRPQRRVSRRPGHVHRTPRRAGLPSQSQPAATGRGRPAPSFRPAGASVRGLIAPSAGTRLGRHVRGPTPPIGPQRPDPPARVRARRLMLVTRHAGHRVRVRASTVTPSAVTRPGDRGRGRNPSRATPIVAATIRMSRGGEPLGPSRPGWTRYRRHAGPSAEPNPRRPTRTAGTPVPPSGGWTTGRARVGPQATAPDAATNDRQPRSRARRPRAQESNAPGPPPRSDSRFPAASRSPHRSACRCRTSAARMPGGCGCLARCWSWRRSRSESPPSSAPSPASTTPSCRHCRRSRPARSRPSTAPLRPFR